MNNEIHLKSLELETKKLPPDGINVINPAFDMTPPELVSGIITENGIAKAPFEDAIKKLFQAN